MALDRPDVCAELREHGGAVTGAGPDLEQTVGRAQRQQLGHARDDQRLRDRLAAADRQRAVVVRGVELVAAGTNSSRGTTAIAASTRSSAISVASLPISSRRARNVRGLVDAEPRELRHAYRMSVAPRFGQMSSRGTSPHGACSRRRGEQDLQSPGKECNNPMTRISRILLALVAIFAIAAVPALAGKPANPGKSKTAPHGKHKGFGKGVTKLKSGTTTLEVDAGDADDAGRAAGFGLTAAASGDADRLDVLIPDHQGPRAPGEG